MSSAPWPPPSFSPSAVESICRALGDAVTGPQIPNLIAPLKAPEASGEEQNTKWKRLFNAVATAQNRQQDGRPLIRLISSLCSPCASSRRPILRSAGLWSLAIARGRSIVGGPPALPRVPANPRVRDGELRGIHAVWADPAPGFVRTPGRRGRAAPGTGVPPGSFLPPPPDDPLPDGQVKGTLRVSLRDRCATPDMPVRSQDRQLSGSGRKTGQALPAPGARLDGFTGTATPPVQVIILHVP